MQFSQPREEKNEKQGGKKNNKKINTTKKMGFKGSKWSKGNL